MFRRLLSVLVGGAMMSVTHAEMTEIDLWPQGAPTPHAVPAPEKTVEPGMVYNISRPVLFVYPAKNPNGQAVITCAGGGYEFVSTHYEGHTLAPLFNEMGVTLAVLKYRTPHGKHAVPLEDASRALEIMRSRGKEWGVRSVGVMGWSAGGHLAASAATLLPVDERPDFQILIYPVISMRDGVTHRGSRRALMGNRPSPELVARYSLDERVDSSTPPAFMVHCADDTCVPLQNSQLYQQALLRHKVPAVLHIYPRGNHGWGSRDSFPYKSHWTTALREWLLNLGI